MNENIQIVNFKVEEWDRPERVRGDVTFPASPYPREWVEERWKKLAMTLQVLRNHLGKPIHISSGYRDPAYNHAIGGKLHSQHMEGRAADILVPGMAMSDVHLAVLDLKAKGELPYLGGLGWYPHHAPPFVHLDVRPNPPGTALIRWEEPASSARSGM